MKRELMRALVTGGAKRLGKEMAIFLAERGFEVAIHYHSSEKNADELVQYIKSKTGKNSIALQADLTKETDSKQLISRASEKLGGPITCLINNASIFEYDNIWTVNRTSWDRHIESNLRSPLVLTQSFANQVVPATDDENGEPLAQGLIINLIDQRVKKLTPEFTSYTIAKMGLWALTQTSAQALAPNIRVNAIGPGPTLKGARQSDEHFEIQRKNTILGRGSDPSEIIAAVGYLLDAKSVTGQLICVDGGQHLAWQTPDVLGVE